MTGIAYDEERNICGLTITNAKGQVYPPFLDLEEQYYIRDVKNGCTASITVTESLLQTWEITKEELEKQAVENMAAEGYSAVALDKILNMEPLPESDRMYVVTNRKGYFGAAIITEPELLAQFAEMLGGEVYILPSSLHEVILIPVATSHTPWSLSQIVYEVNRLGMPEEEILSDSVYYF
ncbi:MAG: DUF5688 family protein [Lachnospiraceae bacterium]|nr:DUF5688 family protein [Lachnospiraceae bacterium]